MEPELVPDFSAIVNIAADKIQAQYGVYILPEAKQVLLDRLAAHRDAVIAELRSGSATFRSITESAEAQLREAVLVDRPDADQRDGETEVGTIVLSVQSIEESMKRKCHWIPWC